MFNSAEPGGPWKGGGTGALICSLAMWGQIPNCFLKPHLEVSVSGGLSKEVQFKQERGAA